MIYVVCDILAIDHVGYLQSIIDSFIIANMTEYEFVIKRDYIRKFIYKSFLNDNPNYAEIW